MKLAFAHEGDLSPELEDAPDLILEPRPESFERRGRIGENTEGKAIAVVLAFNHCLGHPDFFEVGGYLFNLAGVDEHAPHLGRLVHPSEEPCQARRRAAARAGGIVLGGEIAGAKADEGIEGIIEEGNNDLSGFARLEVLTGFWV